MKFETTNGTTKTQRKKLHVDATAHRAGSARNTGVVVCGDKLLARLTFQVGQVG